MHSIDHSSWGHVLRLSIYGGSHDPQIGMHLLGFPQGMKVDKEALAQFMSRRAPGKNRFSTTRREADAPVFLTGLREDEVTSGEEMHAIICNTNQHSSDYASLADIPRPSHADYCARIKYGSQIDLRGGGHWSGRLTAPLCIAGALCKQYLMENFSIRIGAHIYAIGRVQDTPFDPVDLEEADLLSPAAQPFPVLDNTAGEKMQAVIEEARMKTDSVGGIVECAVLGLPVGLGEHMFAGAEGRIASLVYSIPAVKGVEFGDGFGVAARYGSQNNDPFVTDGIRIKTKTNHCGGILGGMTNGMPLLFRCAFKPTPSIGMEQDSVNLSTMENVKFTIHGRHDPCVVPRAVPVVEAAAAIAILDMILEQERTEV